MHHLRDPLCSTEHRRIHHAILQCAAHVDLLGVCERIRYEGYGFDKLYFATALYLIGADRIHSKFRKYLYPELVPKFTNAMTVTAAVPTKQLHVPTIMNRQHGAFVIAPQQQDGSEVLIGRQKRAPELDREGWNQLMDDK